MFSFKTDVLVNFKIKARTAHGIGFNCYNRFIKLLKKRVIS